MTEHGDHLGSTVLVTTGSGGQQFGQRYYGFGNVGYAVGLGSVTDYKYTGQRRESAVLGINLYDYGARFYSAFTGRFLSADTLVPGAGNPQALNRYSYALNNPLKFIDPTGHSVCNDPDSCDNSGGGLVLNEGGDAEEQQCHKICGAAAPEGPEGGADITQEEIAALGQKNAEFFKNTQESIAEVQSQANAASTSVAAETKLLPERVQELHSLLDPLATNKANNCDRASTSIRCYDIRYCGIKFGQWVTSSTTQSK